MSTVFISGSRAIHKLNLDIENRLNNILTKNFRIIIGDANGVDAAIQKYLVKKNYPAVEVYCSGDNCRNNLGHWKSNHIESNKTGRAFFEEKDKKMAEVSDYGFIIWDGKSIGSLNNIAELISKGKKSLIYYLPKEIFITINSNENVKDLLQDNLLDLMGVIEKKGSEYLKRLANYQDEFKY